MNFDTNDVIITCAAFALTIVLYFAYYKVSRGTTLPSILAHGLVLLVRLIAFIGRWLRLAMRAVMIIVVPIMIWGTDIKLVDFFTTDLIALPIAWIWIEATVYVAHLLIGVLVVRDVEAGAEQASAQQMQATIAELQNTIKDLQEKEK